MALESSLEKDQETRRKIFGGSQKACREGACQLPRVLMEVVLAGTALTNESLMSRSMLAHRGDRVRARWPHEAESPAHKGGSSRAWAIAYAGVMIAVTRIGQQD
ncbi:hypothetical protein GW17_00037018 [Ensete ventricosum]|nr:hypothetical protein GW17_00037018 [Ensete ventricosum]